MILWLDLETTGTDPCRDLILEIAFVRTDEDFDVVDEDSYVIGYPKKVIETMCADSSGDVLAMHQRTGLLDRCAATEESIRSIEHCVLNRINRGFSPDPQKDKIVLAGFSVHFDRLFIVNQMTMLAKHLSHRVLDVSSVRRFLEDHPLYRDRALEYSEKKVKAHKALEDCHAAIDAYIFYMNLVTL